MPTHRTLLLLLLICCLWGCKGKTKTSTPKDSSAIDTTGIENSCDSATLSKKPANRTSILIYETDVRKFYMSVGELKRLLLSFPELGDTTQILPPDQTYAKRGLQGKLPPCDGDTFSCEVCHDTYFELYFYFLKKYNGEQLFKGKRDTLQKLYRAITYIYGRLNGSGTYFGHQGIRVLGYAEYSIYNGFDRKTGKLDDFYEKQYSIKAQKALYLRSLKQMITDDVNNNYDQFLPPDRPAAIKDLFKTVDEIDGLITNYFYLSETREFQYSHY
jgi:hypothetical protein